MQLQFLSEVRDRVRRIFRQNALLRLDLESRRTQRKFHDFFITNVAPQEEVAPEIVGIVSFLRQRAILAIAAVGEGQFDLGHIRDLADSAICGHGEAAWCLAKITLAAEGVDVFQQRCEAFVWLELASQLAMKSEKAAAVALEHQRLKSTLSADELRHCTQIAQRLGRKARKIQTMGMP
jgi:hypothetical protein